MAQVVEPSKHEALSSSPRTTKNKTKQNKIGIDNLNRPITSNKLLIKEKSWPRLFYNWSLPSI
jgi:hypothetical protein